MENSPICDLDTHEKQGWKHFLYHKDIEAKLLDEISWRWNILNPETEVLDDIFKLQLDLDEKLLLLSRDLHHKDVNLFKAKYDAEEVKRKKGLEKKKIHSEEVLDFLDKKCQGNKLMDTMLINWNAIKPVAECMSDVEYLQDELIEKIDVLLHQMRFCMKRCAREVAERKKMLAQKVRDKEAQASLEAAKAAEAAKPAEEEEKKEETGEDTVDAVEHDGRVMFLN